MPYATTHILAAIILIELFRNYVVRNNKKFPRYYILIAAIGAVIPDLDIAVYYITYFFGFTFEQVHRMFSHTIFIPLILFVVGVFIYKLRIKNKEFGKRHLTLHTTFFILAAGTLLHLILDFIVAGSIKPIYPFSDYSLGLNLVDLFPQSWNIIILPTLDVILLSFWLLWLEFKLKISNYF